MSALRGQEYPGDLSLAARFTSYELAFNMQRSIPEVLDFSHETAQTQALYGIDQEETREFGEQLLAARRFVERGMRFLQIQHPTSDAGDWDAHSTLQTRYKKLALAVDRPIAGLLVDLEQRGLLDETLVLFATEFGRTPVSEGSDGRDHHPYGFSIWMAGGGIKRGVVHGETDEIGLHAVENRHYVTDVHATIIHQLGLDPRRLALLERPRLQIDYGTPIHEVIA